MATKNAAKKVAAKKVAAPAPAPASPLTGRCMYIWKLAPVLNAEMGIPTFVQKATQAKLSSVWIKVAEGNSDYQNLTGNMAQTFTATVAALNAAGVRVWGWHVPFCPTVAAAQQEGTRVASLAQQFGLDGILMDAEAGAAFFQGNAQTALAYSARARAQLNANGKVLGISSHDIPSNFPNFPFNSFASNAQVNAPQVYYGGSPSVEHRLNRAIDANAHLSIPFVPVGAGWIGPDGGCASASACAERAVAFMNLVRSHGFPGYSFWHWGGAPSRLWETLFAEPV